MITSSYWEEGYALNWNY